MDLLILGASARAAAFSAQRIGLRPTCIDLFADADLASTCPTNRVAPVRYPEGLAELAAELTPTSWLYTGALENHPDLVDRISERHRLLGNLGATLRSVRDPLALVGAVLDAGLDAPRVRLDPVGLPVDGSWFLKPLASGGGRGIHPWLGQVVDPRRPSYYQERIEGLPLSALFVAGGAAIRCQGITRQYVGKAGHRFAYRGSLAPWPVSVEIGERVIRLGEAIASRFALNGLFGVDLILKDGRPWPVEVNPRYTASVEVLEWALGRSLLAEHFRAFGLGAEVREWQGKPEGYVAKAILFADRSFRWPSDSSVFAIDPTAFPEVADIPPIGTEFRPGEPILTVFARGDSPEECRRSLAIRLVEWRRRVGPEATGGGLSDQAP